ncbi:MAG: 1,4-alpha-glucan branching protein GlgB [Oscillospiraceae bacterium]|nr:1,4-alpha-glucan branching protein GlgB [Oscillospiraceae bacterium]
MENLDSFRLWRQMGAHPCCVEGQEGWHFRVWAPNARQVCVMGDFNGWQADAAPTERLEGGQWELFVPGAQEGSLYQYAVHTKDGRMVGKADPYAFQNEQRPGGASRLRRLEGYQWGDGAWLRWRAKHLVYDNPLNIYEVHLGSWRRTGEGGFLSYRDIAQYLVPYVKEMGFTHVELLPVTEHPLDASWGYQCTGYFAATNRFGDPQDFMYLVDQLHQAGIGVLLDWVPAHFPKDAYGLYEFDGQPLYEYADPRKGEHYEWGTRVFDFGREEVRQFLISSALFWLEEYHIDGLRVDAVASMLYLDYDRQDGQWLPNVHGGNGNLEAVEFLQQLNQTVFANHPDVLMIAEESTAWPKVSAPVYDGGLGFNLKWNMGWMNDLCHYIKLDPYFRQHNHKDITFSLMYAFSEQFVLPLSHDEVVHMKGSLLNKMPGTDEEKFAGVRAFYTYMLTHPGKKLLMMGSEFGQWNEWHFEQSLDWHLLDQQDEDGERHRQLQRFFQAANAFYLDSPALWQQDFTWEGFEWICADDANGNTAIFRRIDKKGRSLIVAVNFSPVFRAGYRVGVPRPGRYREVFNSDLEEFGGGGRQNGEQTTERVPCHGQEQSLRVDIPPLGAVVLKCVKAFPVRKKKPDAE